ncbi:MAG: hypothetical protein HZC49_10640 [Nitrospirae bacterium]|nr:hypothetical protein [Nitrospirota bacterium]
MKLFLSVLHILLVVLSPNTAAYASDIVLNGSVYFKCNFISSYMEKHGYVLVEKNLYIRELKTDRYAANDAEVVIKNLNNTVIGTGKTDEAGKFSIPVPENQSYRMVIRFHGREIEEAVSYSDSANIKADMGYFDTEQVGSWIPTPPLQYCYACNIRYLETKKSL